MAALRLAVLLALAASVALPGAAGAAAPTTLYAWSGGMAPFQPLHGARLTADGSLQILEVPPADRGTGTIRIRGTVRPTPAQLAAIRSRAAALPAGAAQAATQGADGSYALAAAVVAGQDRALLSVNGLDPRLGALLDAINAALPVARQLERSAPPVVARRAHDAQCADTPATEVSRTKTLKEAANEGLAKLTAKGGFPGRHRRRRPRRHQADARPGDDDDPHRARRPGPVRSADARPLLRRRDEADRHAHRVQRHQAHGEVRPARAPPGRAGDAVLPPDHDRRHPRLPLVRQPGRHAQRRRRRRHVGVGG